MNYQLAQQIQAIYVLWVSKPYILALTEEQKAEWDRLTNNGASPIDHTYVQSIETKQITKVDFN